MFIIERSALKHIRVIGQNDNIRRDAIARSIRILGQPWLRQVDDRDVRVTVACFLTHAFRLFVPDMPDFCQEADGTDSDAKLAEVLTFIISQFTLINDEKMKEKTWYLIEHCKQVKLFHSVFAVEEEEDGEDNYRADVLGHLFKTILKNVSNKHDQLQQAILVDTIAQILIEGEIEDFLLIDILIAKLCVSNAKINPTAASLVKRVLFECRETDFEETIRDYFNTLFETHNVNDVSRVGARWPEVLPQMSHINPSLFVQCIPMIKDRLDSTLIKSAERMRLTQMIHEVFAVEHLTMNDDYVELWACFEQLGQIDDQKVRETMVRSCGDIAQVNEERRKVIMPILMSMISDKAVAVRERVIETLTELGCHNIDVITDEVIKELKKGLFDRKERVRAAGMKCIKRLYRQYEPLSPRNKMLTLLNQVYTYVTSDVTLRKKMMDVQGLCEAVYRSEILANKDPAQRAKSLLALWRTQDGANALRAALRNGCLLRRAIYDVTEAALSEAENKESFRATLDKLLPFMKVHEKADINVDTLDTLQEILADNQDMIVHFQKFTYMETGYVFMSVEHNDHRFTRLKTRRNKLKILLQMIHDKEKTVSMTSIINLQFLFERALDGVIDPDTIEHVIRQTIELYQMPAPSENGVTLLLYLGKTHEHAFATMDVFTKLREMVKSENKTLLRSGLELMTMLGHFLETVVENEIKSSKRGNDSTDSIDSSGNDIVKVSANSNHISLNKIL